MDDSVSLWQCRSAVVQLLESLQQAGVGQLRKSRYQPPTEVVERRVPSRSEPLAPAPSMKPNRPAPDTRVLAPNTGAPNTGAPNRAAAPTSQPTRTAPPGERLPALQVVKQEVEACRLCAELARTRTQTVFGVGNPAARLCFLGEAPGADEDRKGEPFVGRAGQLLTDMIEKGMGLARADVYILNVLKCRPPGNRTPFPDEVANCRGFFERQLEIIAPEFLCCLGAVAAQNLLETTQPIGRLRGRMHHYRGIKVIATYHPAYLLRNPAAKKDTWEDLKMLMREMGMNVPARE